MDKLYLAGPITGVDGFEALFGLAEDELVRHGYVVRNPCKVESQTSWEAYMRVTMLLLLQSEGLATMDGWERSRGAAFEVYAACQFGMPIASWQHWCNARALDLATARGTDDTQ